MIGRVGQMVVAVGVALVALGILIAASDGPGKSIRQPAPTPPPTTHPPSYTTLDKAVRSVENYAPDVRMVERMRKALANYNAGEYDATVAQHGVSVLAAKWSGEDRQVVRFEVFAEYMDGYAAWENAVVVDVGCGQGALLEHVHTTRPGTKVKYLGIDVSRNMVVAAKLRFGTASGKLRQAALADNPRFGTASVFPLPEGSHKPKFVRGDFLDEAVGIPADYYVCSGCMTIGNGRAWAVVSKAFVAKMGSLARRGILFNMLSTRHMKSLNGFAFYNYEEIQAWVSSIFPQAVVHARHDYLEYRDFTIFVEFPDPFSEHSEHHDDL